MHALEDVPHTLLGLGKLELLPGESRNLYVILVLNGQSHTDLQGRLQKLEAKVGVPCDDLRMPIRELGVFSVISFTSLTFLCVFMFNRPCNPWKFRVKHLEFTFLWVAQASAKVSSLMDFFFKI